MAAMALAETKVPAQVDHGCHPCEAFQRIQRLPGPLQSKRPPTATDSPILAALSHLVNPSAKILRGVRFEPDEAREQKIMERTQTPDVPKDSLIASWAWLQVMRGK